MSECCRKRWSGSGVRRGRSPNGNGAGSWGYRNRSEHGANFSPLTLRRHALLDLQLTYQVKLYQVYSNFFVLRCMVPGAVACLVPSLPSFGASALWLCLRPFVAASPQFIDYLNVCSLARRLATGSLQRRRGHQELITAWSGFANRSFTVNLGSLTHFAV